MTIRDLYNYVENSDLNLDTKISIFVHDSELGILDISDVDYIMKDLQSTHIVFTSKYYG